MAPLNVESVDTLAANEHRRGPAQDGEIEPDAAMVDIPEVERELVRVAQERIAIDLRPSRKTGLDLAPRPACRAHIVDGFRQQRSRSDEIHLPANDVPEPG